MDKDRVEGAGHQMKGSVKEAAGKMTGDIRTRAEGAAEKVAGKAQNIAGGVKDVARDAADHKWADLIRAREGDTVRVPALNRADERVPRKKRGLPLRDGALPRAAERRLKHSAAL